LKNRKLKVLFLGMMTVCLFASCGWRQMEEKQELTEQEEVKQEEIKQEEHKRELTVHQKAWIADIDDALQEEVAGPAEENEFSSEEGAESVVIQTQYISIDLSTAKETYAEGEAVPTLNLSILSKEDNGIDWAYEWYVNGNNAYLKDGIFYGASVLNGYAQPDTCFMFAYDLINDKLLWRSADQSYNTMNFVVKGDIILCGYGFTSEKDYLYQINRNTGEVIDRLELASKPDLLVEQDGKLYVHTYNCNYVIEME